MVVEASTSEHRRDAWWLTAIAGGLAAFWLFAYALHGFTMPIGPDVPVYLWWARLAEAQGVGAPGHRPGATVVLLTLSNALHVPLLPLIGGLLVVAAVSLALVGGLLLRAAGLDRRTWVLGAVLTGFYTRFLLWGYLANLLFALLFVAAVVVIVERGRRGLWFAAALLAAGGLVHPYFLLLGAAIILVTAVGERLRDHRTSEATATALRAVATGGIVAGLGVASTFVGPQYRFRLAPDAILRGAGLRSLLPETYRIQFSALARSDGLWLVIEAILAIVARLGGFVGRFLGSWGFLAGALLPFTLALPVFATQRLVLFGYFLPLLAAVSLRRIANLRPVIGRLLIIGVVGLVVFEAAGWWWRVTPFFTERQLAQANHAAQAVATTDVGTPIVVVVNQEDRETVLPAKALNVLRTAVPPDRIPDVFAYFGSVDDVRFDRPSSAEEPLHTLQVSALSEIRAAGGEPFVVVLAEFNDDEEARDPARRFAPGVFASQVTRSLFVPGSPEPTSPPAIVGAAFLVAFVLLLAGWGLARAAKLGGVAAVALAPAFGVAAITLLGMLVASVRVPLDPTWATVVVAVAAVGGRLIGVGRPARPDRSPAAGT